MTHIFYMMGIIFLLYKIAVVLNPLKATKFLESIKKVKKDNVTMSMTFFAIFIIIYLLWILIGALAASQWALFLCLFGPGMISDVIKRLHKNIYYKSVIQCIDAIVSVTIIGYLIANHFHHFDLVIF